MDWNWNVFLVNFAVSVVIFIAMDILHQIKLQKAVLKKENEMLEKIKEMKLAELKWLREQGFGNNIPVEMWEK